MTARRERFAELLAGAGLDGPSREEDHYLWQIVDEGVLGASRHVALTLELFGHQLDAFEPAVAGERVRLAGEAIATTRGRDAPVVANTVAWLLNDLDRQSTADAAAELRRRIAEWSRAAAERRRALQAVGLRVLGTGARVLAFDYSSTVAELVVAAHQADALDRVVVPESRCIAGGRRYLDEFLAAGIAPEYLIDMAIDHAIARTDVVLLGVESLACDGSFLNTVGSRVIAERALAAGRAVYACTDLFKLDRGSYAGERREPRVRDFDELLLTDADRQSGVEVVTRSPELERVPPDACTGLITEHGLVPPHSIWALGREVFGVQDAR